MLLRKSQLRLTLRNRHLLRKQMLPSLPRNPLPIRKLLLRKSQLRLTLKNRPLPRKRGLPSLPRNPLPIRRLRPL